MANDSKDTVYTTDIGNWCLPTENSCFHFKPHIFFSVYKSIIGAHITPLSS